MQNKTTALIFQTARDMVAKAWCQRGSTGPNGAVCAVAALSAAGNTVMGRYNHDAAWRAKNLFRSLIGNGWIHEWNDHPKRTQEEVVAAFDKAIASVS